MQVLRSLLFFVNGFYGQTVSFAAPVINGDKCGLNVDFRKSVDYGAPSVYYSYGEADCPPPTYLAPDGVNCQSMPVDANNCASFCQTRTRYYYGLEHPFTSVHSCKGPVNCEIGDQIHTAVKLDSAGDAQFFPEAFITGISGGYPFKAGYGRANLSSAYVPAGMCGYWTFIPIVKETCGTYTTSSSNNGQCSSDDVKSIPNVCISQLVPGFDTDTSTTIADSTSDSGLLAVQGRAALVFSDCHTWEAITSTTTSTSSQSAAYQHPEVPLPRTDAYLRLWAAWNELFTSEPTCSHESSNPPSTKDCQNALLLLLDHPDDFVPSQSAKTVWTASSFGSCEINVMYDADWDHTLYLCFYKKLAVAAAAQRILDGCDDPENSHANNIIGGKQMLSSSCPSHVTFANVSG